VEVLVTGAGAKAEADAARARVAITDFMVVISIQCPSLVGRAISAGFKEQIRSGVPIEKS
jgi:hypothetical protein